MSRWPNVRDLDTEVEAYEAAASISMSTSTGSNQATPTHSSAMADGIPNFGSGGYEAASLETAPWPGETFIIREPNQGLAITLVEGQLRLQQDFGARGGCHWACAERNGWLGFRNAVSGTFIGHDKKGNFYAKATAQLSHESFCARRHPKGGYLLLMRHGDEMYKMAIGKDGETLVETKGEGTAWEFVRD